ncbi:MAG: type III-A CRISPR-associated RAMP protein Csm4 [Deltaproteobacteria bacterium]|nr:type III-A CRISPR-associated RAMP protein Csm4 [Deltaproteobacteria bacterium]
MKYTIIKLRPKSSFHIGEREDWREGSKIHIPSDTLFSALCHCYHLLYGEVDTLLDGFLSHEPPFLISSAFPYVDDTYFFPVPKNKIPKDKSTKKIKFVEKQALELLLSGKELDDIINSVKTIPPTEVFTVEDIPRIGLSRLSNHPGENYFYFGQVTYRKDAGLFVLITFKETNISDKIFACFNLLSHEGIGGDRTCGKGMFEKPIVSQIDLKVPDTVGFYSLSVYYPLDEKELSGIDRSFYELEERKGYMFSPFNKSLRRRSIRVFVEGSVFAVDERPVGTLVDVTPDSFKSHKIYRYCFLFALPCVVGGL